MHDDYFIVLGEYLHAAGNHDSGLSAALRERRMRIGHVGNRMVLYCRENAAVLDVPCGGVLVGTLFSRDGRPVADGTQLPNSTSPDAVRRYIVGQCWGNYLLIQPEDGDPDRFTITRSPAVAGNIACIHSIRDGSGFVTSDITLAEHAGLYRRRIDWTFIAHRLRYPDIKTSRTALADVTELLPGETLHLDGRSVSVDQAWSPWDHVAEQHRCIDQTDAAARIREAATSVVHALARMDRKVLLELSGGLDSSIVAACLGDSGAVVSCINLVTPVPGVDERSYAASMARHIGAELHTESLGLDAARMAFDVMEESVAPGMGPLQYAIDQVMEHAAERHGAAAYYSGGGGDSVFCYLRTAAPAADAFKAAGLGVGFGVLRDMAHLHGCTLWKAGRLALAKLRQTAKPYRAGEAAFISTTASEVVCEPHPWFELRGGSLPGDRERIFDLAGNQLFQGQASRGLRRPIRFPLLSQPVVEACLQAPSWKWIEGGMNRALARTAFSADLPDDVVSRRSKATYMSYLGAVHERRKREMTGFLLSGRLQAEGLLDTGAIAAFMAAPLAPRDQRFLRMFDLCMVENWLRGQA